METQHRVSTLKLVDTLDEQAILEASLEATKPPVPAECDDLHYLLKSPFRYGAVYPQGSRFRRAGLTQGVFYASESVRTAIAEIAFYRLLFFADSPATPKPLNASDYTVFSVQLNMAAVIDLTLPPFNSAKSSWMDASDYTACQNLADQARDSSINLIRYSSVRDMPTGINLAILHCSAFAEKAPVDWQTWRIKISDNSVQALRDYPPEKLEFKRTDFSNDPRMNHAAQLE